MSFRSVLWPLISVKISALCKQLIDRQSGHLKPNGIVIIEAGDLSPRAGLRKAFEKAKRGVALPCYADGPADVREMAKEAAASEELHPVGALARAGR